jgi:Clp amino terminal domain, pathogenicity island component
VVDRFTAQARRVMDLGWEEAALLGHRYLGPEHLVLGVLGDGASGAAGVLRGHGVELESARAGLRRLAGRGVVPGPRPSDAELLGTLGIDLDAIRRDTEQTFGRQALKTATREATRARRGGVSRVARSPLDGPPVLAIRALTLAHEQAAALGQGAIGPELLLLGVVQDVQTPRPRCMSNRWTRQLHASVGLPEGYRGAAGSLLAALRVDLEELRAALLDELEQAVR